MTSTDPADHNEGQAADDTTVEQQVATGRERPRAHARGTTRRPGSLPISEGYRGLASGSIERSRLGAANRRRGAEAERRLAAWLRAHGWPHAERAVRTGYRSAGRLVVDPGDIVGTPLLVWQVKDQAREFAEAWLDETEQQRLGEPGSVPADLGLLVVRRRGAADPGRWWVWLPAAQLVALVADAPAPPLSRPVRLELVDLVLLLRAAGYGEPVDDHVDEDAERAGCLHNSAYVGDIDAVGDGAR
ncbi:hypothetical protein GCM10022243_64120 [Saccharothrix violaceirubra]|uniref:Uncharacterized protein n=1 Tax=Saccharothrix violaceirubra TaxID=413306 RepID=A0A7W7T9L3_9PSEU|nr:hypothetical protein [Saccharothrix violaceirubra]MBB4969103.1 hypothetical protein [Saccharothrix violaceirubra]